MRGKPIAVMISGSAPRITPAGAGKTGTHNGQLVFFKDHPRRCGENRLIRALRHPATGSPPQVRGKLGGVGSQLGRGGITPAGAGKTLSYQGYTGREEDHPRRCGENDSPAMLRVFCTGSPPQVRGKLPYPTCFFIRVGITPAGAGKTPYRCSRHQADRDHPRRCGENPAR